jgi:sulfur carrier protein
MPATSTIRIELNGNPRDLAPGTSVAALVLELGLRPNIVAVDVNKKLVPRDAREGCVLAAGDRVEVVTMVGGG